MKKLSLTILFIAFLLITIHYQENLIIIQNGLKTYFEVLFPNMFISMVLIYILHYSNFFQNMHYPLLTKILKMNDQAVGFSITCILLGFPIASILIDETYQKQLINQDGAKRLFYCIHISKLSFIVNQCGILLFHDLKIALLLYFIQLLAIFILLIFTNKTNIYLLPTTSKKLSTSINMAFIQSITSLFYIGGYYLMILCIYEIFAFYLPSFFTSLIAFVLELSNGILILSHTSFSFPLLFVITSLYLTYASLSIHLQIFSMINTLKVSYITFIKYRILHAIIILCLCMIITLFI